MQWWKFYMAWNGKKLIAKQINLKSWRAICVLGSAA